MPASNATRSWIGPGEPKSAAFPALLAKELATLDNLSDGRLVVGVGIGARDDDYEASGAPVHGRGRRLDAQLEEMKRMPIFVGGHVDAAIERAARYGEGWIMGATGPEMFAQTAPKVDDAWQRAGRSGKPPKMALMYYSLGPNARENADRDLKHYYAWLGDLADQIAQSAATTPEMVDQYVQAFEQAGCDELFAFPCSTEVGQVDALAEVAGI